MNIAIIIARIGSKRIKNKNIKFFFGKPIIAYSIINALNSKIFSRVIVSTESKKISNISKRNGIDVNTYKDWRQLTKLYNSRND